SAPAAHPATTASAAHGVGEASERRSGQAPQVQRSWRPQDGQVGRLRRSSSVFFASPACIISHAAAEARAMISTACGLDVIPFLRRLPPRMWVRLKVQLTTTAIGYVRV